ncbi:MAG: septal ring lytic transglycosylase RlpA family protein [Gammaproteobacteria bacterium]|nr:septal ring lytic transglycosylase RlpA family protein [Gammaproteobacteria bacterium]
MKTAALYICKYNIVAGLLMTGAMLLSGCATEPAPMVSVQQPPPFSQDYRHRRAYNRPYRVKGKMYYPLLSAEGYSEIGIASWYGHESGSKTSMGTRFWPEGISAAHKTLPLPSKVRVTNLNNGLSIELTVNDRGPFKPGRIIDLSRGAARKLGVQGLARVKVDYLGLAN